MSMIKIVDDAIWISHIEGDPALQARLSALAPGDFVDLEIDGIVGRWQRMKHGRDGRPTLGIKPVAEMREVWARMRKKPRKLVSLREVRTADAYLRSLGGRMEEWESAEDEAAFRDL